eukprot:TRINITY_DN8825_c0_g1_i4.p2 TRINITY_DN8825_c0_g1~~TRINITY_DN8825_c0_g1_i4.p2  ORF type:complete len:363 (+),score=82.47 TRINITY_DN8825_c0_g1_i4:196-1284(+)
MGGKKGGKTKKAATDDAGDDESTQKLLTLYGKKSVELGTTIPAKVREKFNDAINEGEFLTELNIWDPVGWAGAKALGDALLELKYDKLKSLRFWKCNIEDNGLRYICNYLMINKTVEILECMDNNITWLGCEFLGRVLAKEVESPIATLKLDHNPIGTKGVQMLSKGLAQNPVLKILSLNYCEIDKGGSQPLFEMLIFIKSNLKELYLKGNNLQNEGVQELMGCIKVAKKLERLDLADNKINETGAEGELTKKICEAVTEEKCCVKSYDFSYNAFDDAAVEEIVKEIANGIVFDFKLTVQMTDDFRNNFKKTLDLNKKKAKKMKKGKKGKKKKKKKQLLYPCLLYTSPSPRDLSTSRMPSSA